MLAPINNKGGNSCNQGNCPSRAALRRFDTSAMTTGKAPMIMVGSGAPACWIAEARQM